MHLDKGFEDLDAGMSATSKPAGGDSTQNSDKQASQTGSSGADPSSTVDASSEKQDNHLAVYGDGKKAPDAPMIEYLKMKKKYKREDPWMESEVRASISCLQYYAGRAFSKAVTDSGLSNALVVNKRRGKVFERSSVCEFGNHLLRVPGIETRAACYVRLVHPVIGAMEVYSLHLDHMWETYRRQQFDLLRDQLSDTATHGNLPHILMGDFNAITKSDYEPDYEQEMITDVREKGRWEGPTYTLTEHIASLGYVDFWRRVNATVKDHDVTTCAYHTRIDYMFLSPGLADLVDWEHPNTYAHILNGVFHSDHFPVLANIQFKPKGNTVI